MRVICCVDDHMGMMFHQRRQSCDRVVTEDLMKMCRGKKLWAAPYSRKLLEKYLADNTVEIEIATEEVFLRKAGNEDYCFAEEILPVRYEKNISQLILYRWNRKYPADVYFEIDLNNWNMIQSWELIGHSHEKITKEIYERKEIACASK